jgi:hypothetical protein
MNQSLWEGSYCGCNMHPITELAIQHANWPQHCCHALDVWWTLQGIL